MADGDRPANNWRWTLAVESVDEWALTFEGSKRLAQHELYKYRYRAARAGWRMPVRFDDGSVRSFDVLADERFPFRPPLIALVDPPPLLTWPHIEADGVICVMPANSTFSSQDPSAIVKRILDEAVRWFEDSSSGANTDDFRLEFLSYWPSDTNAPIIRSLLEASGPSRSIAVARLKSFYVVGEDVATIERWLGNVFTKKEAIKCEPAMFVWLDKPLLPNEYPSTAAEVAALVCHTPDHEQALGDLISRRMERIVVVLGAQSTNGPCFAAVVIQAAAKKSGGAPERRGKATLEPGFPPGTMPLKFMAPRFLGSARALKASVQRFDASWVHGRDADPDFRRLRATTVTLVGCGSLGGPVAMSLAEAGVGQLRLIDPDILKAANVGRHPLGVSDVGRTKVRGLAERIRSQYPHILEVQAHEDSWEAVLQKSPDVLNDADLVISTMGDWAEEGALNAWWVDRRRHPALLFGWTEPHAVAGHAVSLPDGALACLACNLDDHGRPFLTVANWPNGTGVRGEPACGVMYQPYGPIEVSHTSTLITESAVDILLGRTVEPALRVWAARQSVLTRAGGTPSKEWLAVDGARGEGVAEMPWTPRSKCPVCGAGQT